MLLQDDRSFYTGNRSLPCTRSVAVLALLLTGFTGESEMAQTRPKSVPSDTGHHVALLVLYRGKWRFAVGRELASGPARLSQLRRKIPDCSKKMLIDTLHGLEKVGWIQRQEDATKLKRVDLHQGIGRNCKTQACSVENGGCRAHSLRTAHNPVDWRPRGDAAKLRALSDRMARVKQHVSESCCRVPCFRDAGVCESTLKSERGEAMGHTP